MPLTAAGKLTIVASSDLGPLGAREGQPVTCNWVPASLAPLLVPWLAMLGLLTLKPNRRAAAWWIWLPLGCVIACTLALPPMLPSAANFVLDVIVALAFGLGAVWLLADYLRRPHRFVTFVCILLALEGFSALAFVPRQDWSFAAQTLVAVIVLGVGALVSAVALSLAGFIYRGRYRRVGLYGWLLILLVVIWLMITAPFFVLQMMASGGRLGWNEFFAPMLAVATVHFATLLPFLILSSASPFYRHRLQALLHLKPEEPPVMAPLPEASVKV